MNNDKKTKNNKVILLSHGDGGVKTSQLINEHIKKYLNNNILNKLEDSAIFSAQSTKIAFTTDTFVVDPIFFPGGDIGKLSICGTLNDLATSGCIPYALSLAVILEEGFSIKVLDRIIKSIKTTIDQVNREGFDVKIVTGDTKVVSSGKADKIYINTSGVGFINRDIKITPSIIKTGDIVIINGPVGDHGIAVLSQREGFDFKTNIKSDCAPLNSLISDIISVSSKIHALRDATRGGLARVLIELSQSANLSFEIDINLIPINKETKGICEFLGMDPLYIANEGKMVVIVDPDDAEIVLAKMRKNRYGKNSSIIGRVGKKGDGMVILKTEIGTKRIMDLHYSEQLPRIC